MAKKPTTTRVQTVMFKRSAWSPARAASWLKKHGFKSPRPDVTPGYLRYRQHDPGKFQKKHFGTISFTPTIKAVVARPKAPMVTRGNPGRIGARRPGRTGELDEHQAREIFLLIDNVELLYRQKLERFKYLEGLKKARKYNPKTAGGAFGILIELAAKRLAREKRKPYKGFLSESTKNEVKRQLVEEFAMMSETEQLGARRSAGARQPLIKHPYSIRLSDREIQSLAYIADRYTYADVLYHAIQTDEDEPDDPRQERTWYLTESDAWKFQQAVEDEDGYMPLAGGELQEKMQRLLDSIV